MAEMLCLITSETLHSKVAKMEDLQIAVICRLTFLTLVVIFKLDEKNRIFS